MSEKCSPLLHETSLIVKCRELHRGNSNLTCGALGVLNTMLGSTDPQRQACTRPVPQDGPLKGIAMGVCLDYVAGGFSSTAT